MHQEWILSMYGGEEKVRSLLPVFYEAYKNTAATVKDDAPQHGDFVASADIDGVQWERVGKQLYVRCVTSLPDEVSFIDERLEIRTDKGDIVDGYARSSCDTTHSVLDFETSFDPDEFGTDIIEIDYSVVWGNANTGKLRALMGSRDVCKEMYLNSVVKEIHILDPVKKAEDKTLPINIAYNRNFVNSSTVDYRYQESFNPNTGYQKLYAPLNVWVEFNDANAIFKEVDMDTFSLKLDCQNGTAYYSLKGRESLVKAHFVAQPDENSDPQYANGFSFKLADEWQTDVPSKRWPVRDRVDMTFYVKYILKNGNSGYISISSNTEDSPFSSGNNASVGWLNLIWGCLAKGTKILMADGSEKAIEEITCGEEVLMDCEGNTAVVTDISNGFEEKNMIHIETLSGFYFVCTEDHPVVTNKGIMKAGDVHGDCRLYTPKGLISINGIWDVPGGDVYNLVLKPKGADVVPTDGCTMFAGGLMVGDHGMQGTLGNIKKKVKGMNPHLAEVDVKRKLWEEIV